VNPVKLPISQSVISAKRQRAIETTIGATTAAVLASFEKLLRLAGIAVKA
jgi:hypothetical protein